MELEHVNLVVTNPRRTAELLERLFGWNTRWSGAGLAGEGTAIHVGTETTYVALADRPTFTSDRYEYPFEQPGLAHVGVLVDDFDDVLERVRNEQIDTFNHNDVEPGRRFYFFDPDDICWEVASYATPPQGARSQPHVSDIALDSIASEFHARGLTEWSDVQLAAAVADVVATPRAGRSNSFVLHAPLEVAARSALLAQVSPAARFTSRLRLVAIAAQYEDFGPAVTPIEAAFEPAGTAGLIDAIDAGDPDAAESAARAVAARSDPTQLVHALAEFIIPLTGAAAHAPIFLNMLQHSDPRGPITPHLLAPLARELAHGSGLAIRWVDEWTGAGATDVGALELALTQAPSSPTESSFIHPVMHAVDESGRAHDTLAPVVGVYGDDAARAILRVAARSMIEDTAEHARYGWTHCLTLPQAVLGIAHATPRPDIALAVAATQVLAFRAAFGTGEISTRSVGQYGTTDMASVIDAAAQHHDAHVVKYVLACMDAATFDPAAASLYHAAAAHLLDVWGDSPVPGDPLAGRFVGQTSE